MKALFITYYFPPLGGAGVQRTLKYVKYLQDFGVSCVIISADEKSYVHDKSLCDDIPSSVRVFRLPSTSFISSLTPKKSLSSIYSSRYSWAGKIFKSVKPFILRSIQALQIPDDKHSWAKLALAKGQDLLNNEKFDLIYSSSPPISCHLVAAQLKQQFNIPWISDYRDQWTGNPYYDAPFLRRLYDTNMERKLLRQANAVTGAHPEMGQKFSHSIGNNKFTYIPNGYDESDFKDIPPPPTKSSDEFVLVHAGSLYGNRSPSSILNALDYLETSHPDTAKKLTVHFVGAMGQEYLSAIQRHQQLNSSRIILTPYIDHKNIPQLICAADALLLLIGSDIRNSGWIVGKVFEYIRACRPILAIAPQRGEIDRMICATGWGVTFNDDAIIEIGETLHKWILNPPKGIPSEDRQIRQYDRKHLASQLFSLFKEVTK